MEYKLGNKVVCPSGVREFSYTIYSVLDDSGTVVGHITKKGLGRWKAYAKVDGESVLSRIRETTPKRALEDLVNQISIRGLKDKTFKTFKKSLDI